MHTDHNFPSLYCSQLSTPPSPLSRIGSIHIRKELVSKKQQSNSTKQKAKAVIVRGDSRRERIPRGGKRVRDTAPTVRSPTEMDTKLTAKTGRQREDLAPPQSRKPRPSHASRVLATSESVSSRESCLVDSVSCVLLRCPSSLTLRTFPLPLPQGSWRSKRRDLGQSFLASLESNLRATKAVLLPSAEICNCSSIFKKPTPLISVFLLFLSPFFVFLTNSNSASYGVVLKFFSMQELWVWFCLSPGSLALRPQTVPVLWNNKAPWLLCRLLACHAALLTPQTS